MNVPPSGNNLINNNSILSNYSNSITPIKTTRGNVLIERYKNYVPDGRVIDAWQKYTIDGQFTHSTNIFDKWCPSIDSQLEKCQDFDLAIFLRGSQANIGTSPEALEKNTRLFEDCISFVGNLASEISKSEQITLEKAYKMLIGILDTYDDVSHFIHKNDKTFDAKSSFILRSAILLSSQSNGISIPSWMAYTKSGKPLTEKPFEGDLWKFLDNWKNWVPESQASMAKYYESTYIKAKKLSSEHNDEALILLKGGFGAGKTRLAGELVGQEVAPGVIAPDLGKRVVRRAMDNYTHASAHIQGSQIAYKIFDDLMKSVSGTLVYDSSLSLARDVSNYLEKAKEVDKKVIIYDVARHDMARILSVLKRSIKGDDPRIPPQFIIDSAVRDTLNRAECMNLILNYKVEKGKEGLAPEYHFIAGNMVGWDNQKVMVISPNSVNEIHPEMNERLKMEGLEIVENENHKSVVQLLKEEQLRSYYADQFERPVREIMEEVSAEERQTFESVFGARVFSLNSSTTGPIQEASQLYDALAPEVKKALPKTAFVEAFNELKPGTRLAFFNSLKKSTFSYLDLPLKCALIIHQNLQEDPFSSH